MEILGSRTQGSELVDVKLGAQPPLQRIALGGGECNERDAPASSPRPAACESVSILGEHACLVFIGVLKTPKLVRTPH